MKITFGILTLCKGGAQRMLAEIANGLARKGHLVEIIMPVHGAIEYDVQAKVTRINKSSIEAADYPQSDVLISNYYTMVPETEKASRQGKGKHVRISLCYEPALMADHPYTFTSYHYTNHLIVLSKWQKDLIKLNHGIEGRIVPVGVSPEFQNLHHREQLGGVINIGAVLRQMTNDNWHRQQDFLIEVLSSIKAKYPHVTIHFITPPNEFRTSKRLIQLKADPRYQFHTPESDAELNLIYNYLHIFVNTSIYDTASLPGLEAMKCGAAVATTYNGGNADYAFNGINSLVSFRYEERLQSDVEKLINEPLLRQTLALSGENEALNWTWEKSVGAFESYLTDVCNA